MIKSSTAVAAMLILGLHGSGLAEPAQPADDEQPAQTDPAKAVPPPDANNPTVSAETTNNTAGAATSSPAGSNGEPVYDAAAVASAPSPEHAHGRVREPERRGEWALWIPRVLLFPLRVVTEVINYPVRKGLYAYEVYSLGPRVKGVFFNEEGTAGVFPVAFVETGFGLNAGGRLVLRELGGTDIGFSGRASFGGRFRNLFSASLKSGETWRNLEFDLGAIYEVRPKDRFFGIGNADLREDAGVLNPVDPVGVSSLRDTRFRQNAIRVTAGVTYRLPHQFAIHASGAIIDRAFSDAEEENEPEDQLANNFITDDVTGFNDGSQTAYSELELRYDSRRAANRWEGPSVPSRGWLATAFIGYTAGLSDDPASYFRYGADVQRSFRIAAAPRVLTIRALLEGVDGSYDEVSFYDLPRLGGPLLLRGHDQDLYRDRVAGLASAEYQFDAIELVSGFLFTDVGRVFPTISDVSLSDMRVGFGGGIEVHTRTSFLGRLTLASSSDGGFFLNLSFDPIYDTKSRVERK